MIWQSSFSLLGLFCSSGFSGYSFCLWHSSCLNFKRKLRTSSFHLYFWFSVSQILCLPFSYLLTSFFFFFLDHTFQALLEKSEQKLNTLHACYTTQNSSIIWEEKFCCKFYTLRILILLLYCLPACWEMLFVPWSVVSCFLFLKENFSIYSLRLCCPWWTNAHYVIF